MSHSRRYRAQSHGGNLLFRFAIATVSQFLWTEISAPLAGPHRRAVNWTSRRALGLASLRRRGLRPSLERLPFGVDEILNLFMVMIDERAGVLSARRSECEHDLLPKGIDHFHIQTEPRFRHRDGRRD